MWMRYIDSIYFTIITLMTVGYGDIHPETYVEKVYIMIVTIFGCGVYGYALNTIGSIFH